MKRIVYMVIMNLFYAPIWLTTIARMAREDDSHTVQERYDYIVRMVKRIIKWGRVTVKVQGQENIPGENGFILFPNHQGLFDPVAIFSTHERPIRAIVKKELTSVILVKDVLKMLEFVPMDRSNVRGSAKIIKYVANEVANGQNFFVFPEGTRSKKGNQILDFKGGTFKIATKAKAPIVPVAIIDSYKVFDRNTIKKTTAQIHYLKPIYYDEYKDLHTNDIAKLVHDRVEECIKEYDKN